jgi:hypothetical protein
MTNPLLYARIIYLFLLFSLTGLFETGLQIGTVSFLIPSILMGLGVAIDVFIATVAKFKDESLSWKSWTLPVTLTHVLFPAVGYFLFYNLSTAFPFAHTALGSLGFILVALFVYEVICEAAGKEPVFGISKMIGSIFSFAEDGARTFIVILAVSWDALWSGPAKAAQATAGNWTDFQVGLSFAIAGIVVALTAELALWCARRLRTKRFSNPYSLAQFNIIGTFVELSVIGGFGVLSLWHVFNPSVSLYQSISLTSLVLIVIFTLIQKPLKATQLAEAKNATQQ